MATRLVAIFLLLLPTTIQAISCLVVRPGYGLVSEQCPPSAVGCRIRVMSDRIDWYEWAKLYDRNQLVCIYPEEYRTESGCQKKVSGSVRCWCGGADDCNDAENSKQLYEKYIGPLEKKNHLTSNRVVTTTKASTTAAATTRQTTTKKVATPRVHIHTTTRRSTTTSTTPAPTQPVATTTKKIFTDVDAHPLPTDARDKYDEIFDETRRALEAQMKEEDERLQQMLMDEEDEMKADENQPPATMVSVEEMNRLERRERARMEEKRRQEEEERLARMEREEAEELERKTREKHRHTGEEDDENEDYVYDQSGGFGLTSSTNICSIFTAIFLVVLR